VGIAHPTGLKNLHYTGRENQHALSVIGYQLPKKEVLAQVK
jgi:hypothetical protein